LEYSHHRKSKVFNELYRPDFAYAISKLSRYTSNPSDDHWTAQLLVVGYVSKTREYAMRDEKYPPILEGYNDAN